MSNIKVDYDILNQKQTPAFYASSLATRPAFGFPGRIFIDTDTPSSGIYRDTGSAWVQVADPGAGTTGTLQQVTTNGNTTTLGIVVQGININDGAGTGSSNTAIGTDALFSNTTGSSNTGIGFQSLPANTTGNNNTGLGLQSLNANTTGGNNVAIGVSALNGNTTASNNTAIGYRSLFANTGAQNTAIGSSALTSNTTGDGNVAVGYLSSQTNTTGVNNSSLGLSSLRLNTTGSNNTAIGSIALQNNTTADNNTAIGYASLSANTTGANNTAIGIQSLLSNTTGTQNTAIGTSALSSNTTGSSNTAIGYNSLNKNTTSGQNTAIGYLTLGENTSGTQNTSIGYGALALNTTGFSNTAIGSNSLAVNTTGSNNTAIGIDSLNVNTGSNNTAIGRASLTANTTGTANTAIGYNSLNKNTTANNNTALGYNSLLNNTTGAGNTAIGYVSMNGNITGGNNVAIGNGSLSSNTSADNNTAIGVSSLTANTTGTQNTAIGVNAGVNITTGGGNTFLGYNAGFGITTGTGNTILGSPGTLSATLTNNIVLSDGAGNVRLFSNDTGKVGINVPITDTPTGQVDIHTSLTNALVLNGNTTNNAYLGFASAGVNKWRIGNTYNAGANSFDIYNIGTSKTALTINSTNAIGIGITPKVWYSSDGYAAIQVGNASLFGRNSDNSELYLSANAYDNASGNATYITDSYATRYNQNVGRHIWYTAGVGTAGGAITFTESMRIAATGNVLIGSTTDLGYKLQASGKIVSVNDSISSYSSGNGTTYGFYNNGGGFLLLENAGVGYFGNFALATGIYTPTSDINKKKDFELSNLGLNEILNLKPTLYRMKTENNTNKYLGFIAQEVKQFIPQAFVENKDFIGLDYQAITATLVKAIQELNEKLVRNNIN